MEASDLQLVTPEEGMRILDEQARRYLGISGQEFIQRWQTGYYGKEPDQPEIVDLALLIPLTPFVK